MPPRSPASWGGARAGAGRRRRRRIPSERHRTRPVLAARHPVHVTARVVPELGSLHRRVARGAVERAVQRSNARADFRIVHVGVLARQLELIVEADDKVALARGMQGFQVTAARALNAAVERRGTVFPDRYRARILRSRAAVRRVLAELGLRRIAWPETALLRRAS